MKYDTGWMDAALCVQTDYDLFHSAGGGFRLAVEICGSCEVRRECLTAALREETANPLETHGVRAGLDAQRRYRALVLPVRDGDLTFAEAIEVGLAMDINSPRPGRRSRTSRKAAA